MPQVKRFAIQHPYGDTVAEAESAARLIRAAATLGVEARALRDSQGIIAFEPDFVLSIAHQDPKLTPLPTYGVMTAPTSWYKTERFVRNILTYDAYLTVVPGVKTWLEDLAFGARKINAPVGFFANTVSAHEAVAGPSFESANLAYVGSNWDGSRHGALFKALAKHSFMRFFGQETAWAGMDSAYAGPLAFDAESVLKTYVDAGIGLCIEHPDFAREGIPTSRIFETVAAGALPICSKSTFNQQWFADTALFVDMNLETETVVDQIAGHMQWVRQNPAEAQQRAEVAQKTYRQTFELEKLLSDLFAFHEETSVTKHFSVSKQRPEDTPRVGVIMRAGGRSISYLRRAIESVANQTHSNCHIILVLWKQPEGLQELLEEFRGLSLQKIDLPEGGRSDCLWAGLNAAKDAQCKFVGVLDDDDEYHPNAIASLVECFDYHRSLSLPGPVVMATGGSLKAFEQPTTLYFDSWIDNNSLIRPEVHHINRFHFGGLGGVNERTFVSHPSSMLIDVNAIDAELMVNPNLELAEDFYLWMQLAERGRIAFLPEIVSTVHEHGDGQSDYAQQTVEVMEAHERIALRAIGRRFPSSDDYQAEPERANAAADELKANLAFDLPSLLPKRAPDAGSPVTLDDLSTYQRVWLYGAGGLAKRMLQMLAAHEVKPAGVADTYQSGNFEGFALLDADGLAEAATATDAILLSSMHWREIAPLLRSRGIECDLLFVDDPLNLRGAATFRKFP